MAPERTLRVIVFGESAALGDPEPCFGVSRFLEALLEDRYPTHRVEVINTAITALNSHAIREIARDSTRLRANAWVIYAGNNEVVGPFGPASMDSKSPPNLLAIRAGLRLRSTALGQWLARQSRASAGGLSLTQRWAGLESFVERQIPAEDPRLASMREHFRANLRDVVRYGLDAGAAVVLSTMAVNLVDCSPFASAVALPSEIPPATADPWQLAVREARDADERGAFAEAVAAWSRAIERRPEDAQARFQRGISRLNLGESSDARADLEAARDLDTLRFRADSGINEATRAVARECASEALLFVDADRRLQGADPGRPPGMDLFYEHVHLRPEGNYALARLFAEAIAPRWDRVATPAPAWLDYKGCLERLGWTTFAESRIWSQIRALCQRPPFAGQSIASLRDRFLDDRIHEAGRGIHGNAYSNVLVRLGSQLERHPDDWQLREQFARVLQAGRRWKEAADAWARVTERAPGHVVAWFQLGESLQAAGDPTGAAGAFRKALGIRPDFVEARIGLGYALGSTGDYAGAIAALDQALTLAPKHLQARVNRGVALIGLSRFDEAEADLRRAAAENPGSIVPWLRLGELLSNRKAHEAAADAYLSACRIETNNAPARHKLAIEFSRAGKTNEAEAEFRRVIEQAPQSAIARVDLGVLLARQSRYREAAGEFESALKLQPTNALAEGYLRTARSRLMPKEGP